MVKRHARSLLCPDAGSCIGRVHQVGGVPARFRETSLSVLAGGHIKSPSHAERFIYCLTGVGLSSVQLVRIAARRLLIPFPNLSTGVLLGAAKAFELVARDVYDNHRGAGLD